MRHYEQGPIFWEQSDQAREMAVGTLVAVRISHEHHPALGVPAR
jgi:hypothetical protein